MTLADEKKGITVKIDADLHAEVREYIEQHGMTMAEFITLAVDNELHPKYQNKEEKNMGNMRTMAFQVPEELFQRIKGYLQRNNMSQKQFVLGLIEAELDREQAQRNGVTEDQQTGGVHVDPMDNTGTQFPVDAGKTVPAVVRWRARHQRGRRRADGRSQRRRHRRGLN